MSARWRWLRAAVIWWAFCIGVGIAIVWKRPSGWATDRPSAV